MSVYSDEYYIGSLEIFAIDGSFASEIWQRICNDFDISEWECHGRKIFPIRTIDFWNNSASLERLEQALGTLQDQIGKIIVKGQIFSVNDYKKEGCRVLKIRNNIEPVIYEIGYVREGGYFDWTIQESSSSCNDPENDDHLDGDDDDPMPRFKDKSE